MEKYSRYRDQGTGIAPFFPIPASPVGVYLPGYILLFLIRVPLLLSCGLAYFLVIQWLPVGSLVRKAALWTLLGIPGIWWVDLQVDGVKRGNLSKSSTHLPQPGSIIVSSSTSPLDALYLAAIFDPVFTRCYTFSRRLQHISLFSAIAHTLSPSSLLPGPLESNSRPNSSLVSLADLVERHPDRIIVIFAESTTTNGRAILPLSPCLGSAPSQVSVFPTNLRYNPGDVTTPVPGWRATWRFFWNLCSTPTHTIRVRIAEPLHNTSSTASAPNELARTTGAIANTTSSNFLDALQREGRTAVEETIAGNGVLKGDQPAPADSAPLSADERKMLDHVGESLARLGRVKRVALNVKDKADFVKLWRRRGRA